MTIEEHDEALIDNWNKVVGKRDLVYHLGDVGMDRPAGYFGAGIYPRLNGRKYVIGGNHDTPEILAHFDKVNGCIRMDINGRNCMLTHIPIHPQEMWWEFNLHGHLHGGTVKKFAYDKDMRALGERDPRYINCCCEHLNYTPQLLEDVVPRTGERE
jgi:calcineurin-like phosphoesterase family protein